MTEIRTRREPPPFRTVEVVRVEPRSPHMVRITLAGPELEGFDPGLPAASVRLFLPGCLHGSLPGDSTGVVLPTWRGNEFLLEDGSRPIIRTLTPLRFEPGGLPRGVVSDLEARGHTMSERSGISGDVEAIMVMPDGTLEAAADPRRGGAAVGW